ncbi:MAG: 5,6-dimethylbenzimidazole synthase [Gammaproteobacteria bacterium]|nr:5,6-dimethylbenzimidazole synthase [Gammaproteobacteria bacterium]
MENKTLDIQAEHFFSEQERAAVYKTIFTRRDVRGQFKPDPVPDEVLARVLTAAHHAPSVGFMQPWNFLLIKSIKTKQKIHDLFVKANAEAAAMFEGERRDIYTKLKLEGILSSPINLCITCDHTRSGPVVIGRTHDQDMDLYSSVCAAQNLWLAARAEGLGVGWVSIFNKDDLKQALDLPEHVTPIAYLCIGYVEHFFSKPELETGGWRERLDLERLINLEHWGNDEELPVGLVQAIEKARNS